MKSYSSTSNNSLLSSATWLIYSIIDFFKKEMPNLRVNTMVSLNTKSGPSFSHKKYPIAWYLSWDEMNKREAETLVEKIRTLIKERLYPGEGDFENQSDDLGAYYYFYFKDVNALSKVAEEALSDITLCTNNFHLDKKNLRSRDIISFAEDVMELAQNPY